MVAEGRTEGLPETVLAMVEARIASLEPDARRVLRAGSIFGEVFCTGAVSALVGSTREAAQGWLGSLVSRELLRTVRAARFAGETEYAFRHALLREGAYRSLTAGDRAHGHRLAAAWLQEVGEGDAYVLAMHQQAAGELGDAAALFARAADQAILRGDLPVAESAVERGLACGAGGPLRGGLLQVQGDVHALRDQIDQAVQSCTQALTSLGHGTERWWRAAATAADVQSKSSDYRFAREMADQLLGEEPGPQALGPCLETLAVLARSLRHDGDRPRVERVAARIEQLRRERGGELDDIQAARADAALATYAMYVDYAWTAELAAAALERFERLGDQHRAGQVRLYLGASLAAMGAVDVAQPQLEDTVRVARRWGGRSVEALALCNVALCHLHRGDAAGAAAVHRQALALWSEGARPEYLNHRNLAMALVQTGELEAARYHAEKAVALRANQALDRAQAQSVLASVALAAGEVEAALQISGQAMAVLEEVGELVESEAPMRLVHARILDAAGDRAAAHQVIGQARDRLLLRAGRIQNPAYRTAFLEGVPTHVQILALAARGA
jgi:tetratricopeptide (TPR) repeat protein